MTTELLLLTETLGSRAPRASEARQASRRGGDDDFARTLANASETRERAREREASRLARADETERNAETTAAADRAAADRAAADRAADAERDAEPDAASDAPDATTAGGDRPAADDPDRETTGGDTGTTGQDAPDAAHETTVAAQPVPVVTEAPRGPTTGAGDQVVRDQPTTAGAGAASAAREAQGDTIGSRANARGSSALDAAPRPTDGAPDPTPASNANGRAAGDGAPRDGERTPGPNGRVADGATPAAPSDEINIENRSTRVRAASTPAVGAEGTPRDTPATPDRTPGIAERLASGAQADSAARPVAPEATPEPTPGRSVGQAVPAAARAVQVETSVQLEQASTQLGGAPVRATTGGTQVLGATLGTTTTPDVPGTTAPAPEIPEVPGRVLRGLSAMVNQRGGVMSMRLDPPELGQMRVQMSILRGAVAAQFTATTVQAQAMLESNLGVLRTALEAQGLAVDKLSVHLQPSTDGQTSGRQEAGEDSPGNRRQDAAGGESRGRRDGQRDGDHEGAPRRGFADDLGLIASAEPAPDADATATVPARETPAGAPS